MDTEPDKASALDELEAMRADLWATYIDPRTDAELAARVGSLLDRVICAIDAHRPTAPPQQIEVDPTCDVDPPGASDEPEEQAGPVAPTDSGPSAPRLALVVDPPGDHHCESIPWGHRFESHVALPPEDPVSAWDALVHPRIGETFRPLAIEDARRVAAIRSWARRTTETRMADALQIAGG